MRLKEIKPGMAIHCKTETEAKELLGHLHEKGYRWSNGDSLAGITGWEYFEEYTCYYNNNEKTILRGDAAFYKSHPEKCKYIRYTDLILPELTAEEVLQVFGEICTAHNPCGECPILKMLDGHEKHAGANCFMHFQEHAEEITQICAKWKAEHEKKELEFERVDICRIIKVHPGGRKECVYEEDITERELPFGGCPEQEAEKVLKKYIAQHEGNYFTVTERVCRVKE